MATFTLNSLGNICQSCTRPFSDSSLSTNVHGLRMSACFNPSGLRRMHHRSGCPNLTACIGAMKQYKDYMCAEYGIPFQYAHARTQYIPEAVVLKLNEFIQSPNKHILVMYGNDEAARMVVAALMTDIISASSVTETSCFWTGDQQLGVALRHLWAHLREEEEYQAHIDNYKGSRISHRMARLLQHGLNSSVLCIDSLLVRAHTHHAMDWILRDLNRRLSFGMKTIFISSSVMYEQFKDPDMRERFHHFVTPLVNSSMFMEMKSIPDHPKVQKVPFWISSAKLVENMHIEHAQLPNGKYRVTIKGAFGITEDDISFKAKTLEKAYLKCAKHIYENPSEYMDAEEFFKQNPDIKEQLDKQHEARRQALLANFETIEIKPNTSKKPASEATTTSVSKKQDKTVNKEKPTRNQTKK